MGTIKSIRLEISGMTCEHCARSVEKILSGVEGVIEKSISYPQGGGRVRYDSSKVSPEVLKSAIDASGHYRVRELHESTSEARPSSTSSGSHDFDLIIIGGGSAAFSAAGAAGELGKKTLMINGGLPMGGTCVNVGCVPSKYLIRAASAAYHAGHTPFRGLRLSAPDIDFSALMSEKEELVESLREKKYLSVAAQIPGLTLEEGMARLIDAHHVESNGRIHSGQSILIATGSQTYVPPIKGLQESNYLTSRTLFELKEKPESLSILGAGYIGIEIAQAYHRLGVKVRLLEFTDRPLRSLTPDLGREIQKHLEAEGILFYANFRIDEISRKDGKTLIKGTDKNSGKSFEWTENGHIVLATGLAPNTDRMGLEEVGIERDERGFVKVSRSMQTSVENIYAAGDCVNTPAYVYTAAREGKTAAINALTGGAEEVDYNALPWVVFSDPQVAGAGMDEAEAEAAGIPWELSTVPLSEVPKALASRDTRGFIKLIRNRSNDRLIGARFIAAEAGELAMQASLAIRHGISTEELAATFYPYLTLSEGIKLAAITFKKDISTLSCCAS